MADHTRAPSKSTFQLEEVIGTGAFGVVYRAQDPSGEVGRRFSGQDDRIAIKKQECTNPTNTLDDPRFRESYLMAVVNGHPNIVTFLGHFFSPGYSNLIMECIPRAVTLLDLLRGRNNHFTPYNGFPTKQNPQDVLFHFEDEDEIWVLVRQLISAITHCHKRGICHRDIKPENILLTLIPRADPENHCLADVVVAKLCDFGLADFIPSSGKFTAFPGTKIYAAPELLQGKPYDGPKAELWSVGVIIYMMFTGCHPFGIRSREQMIQNVLQGLTPDFSRLKSLGAKHLLPLMFKREPAERIDFSLFERHPWYTKCTDCKLPDLFAFDDLRAQNQRTFPSLFFLPRQKPTDSPK